MLIERSLRAIWFGTWFDRTFVESLDFMSISTESFSLLISLERTVALLILNWLEWSYLIFAESVLKMIFLFYQFFDLVSKCDIGKE